MEYDVGDFPMSIETIIDSGIRVQVYRRKRFPEEEFCDFMKVGQPCLIWAACLIYVISSMSRSSRKTSIYVYLLRKA